MDPRQGPCIRPRVPGQHSGLCPGSPLEFPKPRFRDRPPRAASEPSALRTRRPPIRSIVRGSGQHYIGCSVPDSSHNIRKGDRTRREPVRSDGFTLLELLVVLTVLAVLAALLLPALMRGKASATRVACISNLRQLAMTWQMYAQDANDRLVPNGYATPETLSDTRLWVLGATHRADAAHRTTLTNTAFLTDSRYAAFAPYLPNARVYKCPADRLLVDGRPKVRSYALNAYLGWALPDGGGEFLLSPVHQNFTRLSQVLAAAPAERLQFVDVAPEWLCHAAFGIAMIGVFYHFPSVEHGPASPVSFADGHVATQRWRDPWTFQMARSRFVTHLNWAFQPSADLQWLRQHATVPR